MQGTCRGIPGTVVIKDLEVRNQQSVEDWKKELMVMRCAFYFCSHLFYFSKNIANPYVAKVFGYCCDQNILTIVMEYMPIGTIYFLFLAFEKKN